MAAHPEILGITNTLKPSGVLDIDCTFRGIPTPTISWVKGSLTVSSNANIFISISNTGVARLSIDQAAAEDSGMYQCIATNDAGSDSMASLVMIDSGKNNYRLS